MAKLEELKKDFKKLITGERLAHAYLFFGHESREEKLQFAKELANHLETGKWEVGERVLNDFLLIDGAAESGIDVMRSASRFLWQKPAVSKKRTLVISEADNLTIPAQNAILKIAEEPPQHALIMLLLKNHEGLLPALQSRFQKIFVSGASGVKHQASGEIGKFLKAGAAGRKEIIKEILEEETGLEDFVAGIIAELQKDKLKNWKTLRELLKRWALINQFNVNKKLQLEAALINL